jgi:hypothetical protein
LRIAVTGGSSGFRWSDKQESRGPARRLGVGWASRLWMQSVGEEGIKKALGPDLAHGSWFVPVAALPPGSNSRWAQISRQRR